MGIGWLISGTPAKSLLCLVMRSVFRPGSGVPGGHNTYLHDPLAKTLATSRTSRIAWTHECHRSSSISPNTLVGSARPQERGHGDVFVGVGPMDALAAADQPPMFALLGGGVPQPWKPLQGRVEFPPVRQDDVQRQIGRLNIDRVAIKLQSRNADARPP